MCSRLAALSPVWRAVAEESGLSSKRVESLHGPWAYRSSCVRSTGSRSTTTALRSPPHLRPRAHGMTIVGVMLMIRSQPPGVSDVHVIPRPNVCDVVQQQMVKTALGRQASVKRRGHARPVCDRGRTGSPRCGARRPRRRLPGRARRRRSPYPRPRRTAPCPTRLGEQDTGTTRSAQEQHQRWSAHHVSVILAHTNRIFGFDGRVTRKPDLIRSFRAGRARMACSCLRFRAWPRMHACAVRRTLESCRILGASDRTV